MKEKETAESVLGTPSKQAKESRYQLSISEIKTLASNPKLLETFETLAKDEENKGQAGSYLIAIAKAINKQLKLV